MHLFPSAARSSLYWFQQARHCTVRLHPVAISLQKSQRPMAIHPERLEFPTAIPLSVHHLRLFLHRLALVLAREGCLRVHPQAPSSPKGPKVRQAHKHTHTPSHTIQYSYTYNITLLYLSLVLCSIPTHFCPTHLHGMERQQQLMVYLFLSCAVVLV